MNWRKVLIWIAVGWLVLAVLAFVSNRLISESDSDGSSGNTGCVDYESDLTTACADSDSDPASLSSAAQRLVRYSFTDLGASRSETKCAVDAFVERIGAPELNAAAQEFKDGDTERFMAHRLDVALVAEECDVDDHRQVNCDRPQGEDERDLCRTFDQLTTKEREN